VASSLCPSVCLILSGRPILFRNGSPVLTHGSQDENVKLIFSHSKKNSSRIQVFRNETASIEIKSSLRTVKETRKIFKGFLNEKKQMGSNEQKRLKENL